MSEAVENKPMMDVEIRSKFRELDQQRTMVLRKISELEQERKEHQLVLDQMETVEDERRCFRMVGGVLMERSVKEVAPALKENKEKITQAVEQYQTMLQSKDAEINAFIQQHGLLDTPQQPQQPEPPAPEKKSSGVLV